MVKKVTNGHNPYFNRWFSAIVMEMSLIIKCYRHNPYFNRWFSAMEVMNKEDNIIYHVTILILIDGFLQYLAVVTPHWGRGGHNPYFNRWFSAIKGF